MRELNHAEIETIGGGDLVTDTVGLILGTLTTVLGSVGNAVTFVDQAIVNTGGNVALALFNVVSFLTNGGKGPTS